MQNNKEHVAKKFVAKKSFFLDSSKFDEDSTRAWTQCVQLLGLLSYRVCLPTSCYNCASKALAKNPSSWNLKKLVQTGSGLGSGQSGPKIFQTSMRSLCGAQVFFFVFFRICPFRAESRRKGLSSRPVEGPPTP